MEQAESEVLLLRDYQPKQPGHLHDAKCRHRLYAFPPRRRLLDRMTTEQMTQYMLMWRKICETDGVAR